MTAPVTAQMVARSRTLADPRWSPDGRLLAWVESFSGRADLVVAPADGSGPSVVVTADVPLAKSGSPFAWAPAGHEIVYAAGDGRLLAVSATGGPVRVLSRDGRVAAPSVSGDGTRVAFVLERDDACDIAVVPLDGSAWPVRISTGADWAFDPAWAADGRALAWHEWDFPDMPWDGSRLVLRPVDGCTPDGPPLVVEGGDGVAVGQPRFSPDGSALAFVCDRSGFTNLWVARADGAKPQPVLEEPYEHAEPTWGPGQCSFAWSSDGTALALCRNEAGFGRLVVCGAEGDFPARRPWRQETARRPWRQETARRPWRQETARRPGRQETARRPGRQETEVSKGWHHGLDWGAAGIACVRSGACTPPGVTILEPGGGQRRVLAQGAPGALEAAGPVEPEAVMWTGDDGATVHGLLYRPPEANPPLIVYVHGGPTGMAAATWWPRHQFWVSRGWAVLAPNYRGSTGYGRSYTQALTDKWGEIDVSDVAAGIRHAGKEGWGDPARVALDGGSAGGFTVLLVCAHHPGLVRAAVVRYAVADLFHLAEATHRYESRYLDRIVGPLPEAAGRYRERSPVNLVERIGTPLLVLQGDADEVVPKAQADALVEGLRRRDVPVEYHVYEGEGHGWSRPEAVADELERAEAFLTRWVLRR